MAAIVTNNLKKQLLQTIVTDISADSANYYYIGISRSNPWDETDTVPTVGNTEREKRNFLRCINTLRIECQ